MCDYTKQFLAAADKNKNKLIDDVEGDGLDIMPKEITSPERNLLHRIIQDEGIMKRLVRYTILTKDEQKMIDKELRILELKSLIDENR